MVTERQVEILNRIVREYIERAQPVSSQLLEKKHKFGLSTATIRSEMQKLTEGGYLSQLHISGGRIPTDKGYRFFVDELLENNLKDFAQELEKPAPEGRGSLKELERQIEDSLEFIREATEFLAEESSNLALGYSLNQKVVWKEGWRGILEEPEFSQPGFAASFARVIDDFEENIDELFSPEIKIYIGKENPFSKARDFSIITSGFSGGLFALLGPKRMSYDKNISLLAHLWEKTKKNKI